MCPVQTVTHVSGRSQKNSESCEKAASRRPFAFRWGVHMVCRAAIRAFVGLHGTVVAFLWVSRRSEVT